MPVSWEITMSFVHLAALAALLMLYRSAPCWMQKLVMGLLIVAMVVFTAAHFAVLAGVWEAHFFFKTAFAIEHVAVLLYVFRLIYQDRLQWTPSPRSPSSPR